MYRSMGCCRQYIESRGIGHHTEQRIRSAAVSYQKESLEAFLPPLHVSAGMLCMHSS